MALRTPLKAIRTKCIDCCCGQMQEIRECSITDCALWEYRMGHRPPKDISENVMLSDDFEDLDV